MLTVKFTALEMTVSEGAGVARLTVLKVGESERIVIVEAAAFTSDGTAVGQFHLNNMTFRK